MKFKKSLLISMLGFSTISLVATAGVSLSSCSSTSNPYAKFTNINATIGGEKYTFKYNTNSTFGIIENNNFLSNQDLYNKIYEIKDDNNKPLKLQPNMKNVYPQQWQAYIDAIKKYNNTYIASQIYSYLASFMSYFTEILMKSQPYIYPINSNDFIDVTQWTQKQNSDIAKELLFATRFGSGEGYQTYSVWPKTIDLDFDLVNQYKTPGDSAYLENDDPNTHSIKININKFDVTYSWYKQEQVGGEYISNINTINNSLTTNQKDVLKNKFGIDKLTRSEYKISWDLTNSPIEFNYNPGVIEYTDPADPKIKTRIYSGQGLIGSPWIQENKKWVMDIEKQAPYTILSNNSHQTLQIVKQISLFFKDALVNNKNYLPFRAYELIWKIGYFSTNSDQNEVNKNMFQNEVISKQSWFLEEKNLLDTTSIEWTKLKNNKNYSSGIEQIYKLFKI